MENNQNSTVKEPFVRIVKRSLPTKRHLFSVKFFSILVAILLVFIFVLSVGKGEITIKKAYQEFIKGSFGILGNSKSMKIQIWDTVLFMAKLLIVAVALAPAFKMHFWNCGGEGQIIMGGLVAGIFMHNFVDFFKIKWLAWIVVILLSMLAGAIWAVIPAICKAEWGTNETLFTLMLNYVAMKIMDYFYNNWKGLNAGLEPFNSSTWIDPVFGQGYGLNIIIFFLMAIIMYFYLKKTKQGYEITVVGESPNTARYAGIPYKWVIIRTMIISGAVCGLCGALTVGGQVHCICYSGEAVHTVTNGYGFTAIIVAWLANFNTISMFFYAFLIQFLTKGAGQLGNKYSQFATGAGNILTGIVLFCIIGGAFFANYRLVFCEKIAAPFRKVFGPVGKWFNDIFDKIGKFFSKLLFDIKQCFYKLKAKLTKQEIGKISSDEEEK